MAPIWSAETLVSAPSAVRLETMMTGVGRSSMILRRKSSPFMPGMATSSVTTSGSSARISSRACIASQAEPTTEMSGAERALAISRRIRALSSTTATRITSERGGVTRAPGDRSCGPRA
jgi:hypothetical protein